MDNPTEIWREHQEERLGASVEGFLGWLKLDKGIHGIVATEKARDEIVFRLKEKFWDEYMEFLEWSEEMARTQRRAVG